MPSQNTTPYVRLNQWQGNEYPKREDFVEDNLKIETRIKENADAIESHLADMTKLIKIKPNIVILSTGWIDDTVTSGFLIYDITDEDIDENTMVDVNIDLSDLEKASAIKSVVDSFDGYVRLYADEQPTENIIADIRLTRQVVVDEG